jgi:hypothetical protein
MTYEQAITAMTALMRGRPEWGVNQFFTHRSGGYVSHDYTCRIGDIIDTERFIVGKTPADLLAKARAYVEDNPAVSGPTIREVTLELQEQSP